MKKNFLLISALFLSTSVLKAEEQKQSSQTEPKVNIGLKAGFNSSMYFTSRLQLDGQRFEDIQNNYKVGYFAALFFRFNMKRHFIQPEFTYNVNKGDITFDKNQNNETLPPDFATIRSTIIHWKSPCCMDTASSKVIHTAWHSSSVPNWNISGRERRKKNSPTLGMTIFKKSYTPSM